MFSNLVESASHEADIRRRSSFFVGTLAIYLVFLMVASIASVHTYNTHLGNQSLELISLVPPISTPLQQLMARPEVKPNSHRTAQQAAIRNTHIAAVTDSQRVPDTTSTIRSSVPVMPRDVPVVVGNRNIDIASSSASLDGSTSGPFGSNRNNDKGTVVKLDSTDNPPPLTKPTVAPKPVTSLGVLNGKAISKPAPPYPSIARVTRASGIVTVQIIVNEFGAVTSASAVNGHPLLRQAAVQAAYQAKFSQTLLSNQPVKVSGVITYNFVLQ